MPGMFAHVAPFLESIETIREAYPEIDPQRLNTIKESAYYHDAYGMASNDGFVSYSNLFRLMEPHAERSDDRKRDAWNFTCDQLHELHDYIRRLDARSDSPRETEVETSV